MRRLANKDNFIKLLNSGHLYMTIVTYGEQPQPGFVKVCSFSHKDSGTVFYCMNRGRMIDASQAFSHKGWSVDVILYTDKR